jgi:hypothetical protein
MGNVELLNRNGRLPQSFYYQYNNWDSSFGALDIFEIHRIFEMKFIFR